MNRIYLDTETTSLIPGEIAQLSMIAEDMDSNKFLGAYNYYFSVKEMSDEAEAVHSLSKEKLDKLSKGYTFKDKCERIYELLKDSVIVAHNEKFDEKFICMELWRCGIIYKPIGRICTMELFKNILKIPNKRNISTYKRPKLSELVQYLRIDEHKLMDYSKEIFDCDYCSNTGFHDSMYDTSAIYVCTNIMREKIHGGNSWINKFTY